ncbi:MAG: hypothetical protein QF561_05375 [Phycisphaerales bacterium]|jgi:hypothetical protein|nr:hypothetical protein [Phycisphaerales bacterium]
MKRLVCVLLLVPLSGCYRPLFDDKLPRHQYQSYDAARNGPVPTEEYDLFGNPQPVLRARLSD